MQGIDIPLFLKSVIQENEVWVKHSDIPLRQRIQRGLALYQCFVGLNQVWRESHDAAFKEAYAWWISPTSDILHQIHIAEESGFWDRESGFEDFRNARLTVWKILRKL